MANATFSPSLPMIIRQIEGIGIRSATCLQRLNYQTDPLGINPIPHHCEEYKDPCEFVIRQFEIEAASRGSGVVP